MERGREVPEEKGGRSSRGTARANPVVPSSHQSDGAFPRPVRHGATAANSTLKRGPIFFSCFFGRLSRLRPLFAPLSSRFLIFAPVSIPSLPRISLLANQVFLFCFLYSTRTSISSED